MLGPCISTRACSLLALLRLNAGSCTQWSIYDEYIKDLERQRVDENLKSKGGRAKHQDRQGASAQQQQASTQKKPDSAMRNPHLGQVSVGTYRMSFLRIGQLKFDEGCASFLGGHHQSTLLVLLLRHGKVRVAMQKHC